MTGSHITCRSLGPGERIFEALEFGANIGGALGDGYEKDKEDSPSDEVRRKDAIEIFH
jgi:hypothetical protein